MTKIAVISTKGGAGKSTTAVQYAVALQLNDKRSTPLIMDCDEAQNSVRLWSEALREVDLPEIRTASDVNLENEIASAEADGFDPVIIDVPPGGGSFVARIASIADHIIIPVRPSAFDIHAMRNTVDLLRITVDDCEPEALACRNALGKAVIVLNAIPQRSTPSWRTDIERALDKCGAGGLAIVGALSDRASYRNSIGSGKGVLEVAGDAKAKAEVMLLYENMKRIIAKRKAAIRKAEGGR